MGDDKVTHRLRISDAAVKLGVTPKTVYSRINKYGWKQEQDDEGRSWVWIPEEVLHPVTPEVVTQVSLPITPEIQIIHPVTPDINELFNRLERQYEERLKEKDEQIRELREVKDILNRELENRNTQIQKYREKEDRVTPSATKPWWKVW